MVYIYLFNWDKIVTFFGVELFVQMDSVIGHAHEAYNALRYQRSTFGDISSKINTIGSKLPSVSFLSFLPQF